MIHLGKLDRECVCGSFPTTDPNPDCERCCLVWTVARMAELRAAQKEFFRTRKRDDLERAQKLERLVDQAIERLARANRQKYLFSEEESA